MTAVALHVDQLGKRYTINRGLGTQRFSERLTSPGRRLWHFLGGKLTGSSPASTPRSTGPRNYWALKDVTFEIPQGDVVGLIGRNGAGKSTLLKVLSRITEPTCGRVGIAGRVGSLLEVGTGFHPELTGRENIYLNGAILGMSRSEVRRHFDEIVAFAEVETFLDTAVKHYSSGMYVRLGFAVAAHLPSDVLLVDEVLAVGDHAFQRKCLSTMGAIARGGRTVIFVSHNLLSVRRLCHSALWLDQGQLRAVGDVDAVTTSYMQALSAAELRSQSWSRDAAPGSTHVLIRHAGISTAATAPERITMRTPLELRFAFEKLSRAGTTYVNFHLLNDDDVVVFASFPPQACFEDLPPGAYENRCVIPGYLLKAGRYRILLRIIENSTTTFTLPEALVFDVADDDHHRGVHFGEFAGVVRPLLNWQIGAIEIAEPLQSATHAVQTINQVVKRSTKSLLVQQTADADHQNAS